MCVPFCGSVFGLCPVVDVEDAGMSSNGGPANNVQVIESDGVTTMWPGDTRRALL